MKPRSIVCCLLLATIPQSLAHAADPAPALNWKEKPPHPHMTLGLADEPPVLDGRVAPGEWAQANGISSLQELRGEVGLSFPPTRVYLMRDETHLYFAFQCAKASPSWYEAKSRFRDSPVYLDGNYVEFYLSPPDEGEHTPVYQFNINAYGAVADWRVVKEIGVKHPGYNPELDLARSETSTRWTLEGRIRLDSLDPGGFRDGQTWRTNWARSWPQRAWALRPGFFVERRNMGGLHIDVLPRMLQWGPVGWDGESEVRLQATRRAAMLQWGPVGWDGERTRYPAAPTASRSASMGPRRVGRQSCSARGLLDRGGRCWRRCV